MTKSRRLETILLAASLVILLGLLYAGLKPFGAPLNTATWSVEQPGVRLGQNGTLLSTGSFPPLNTAARSLEIWLEPSFTTRSGSIITFYDPAVRRGVSIHQSSSDFELRIGTSMAWGLTKSKHMFIDNGLQKGRRAFWTVTSGPAGTTIFKNGSSARKSAEFLIQSKEFAGRLIVGTSPIFDDRWSGSVQGLAVYNHELTADQVWRHYITWDRTGMPDVTAADACVALYVFDERSGSIGHNQLGTGYDLLIPRKYMVLRQTVLDPFWRAFAWSKGFWKDAILNIAGFVPAGFVWCGYFRLRGIARPWATSSSLAVAVSLMIELVQSHLPTRDSSLSDLIANSAGGLLGAGLYRTQSRILGFICRKQVE